LIELGYDVKCSDIIEREYPCEIIDFLLADENDCDGRDIISNPPYKYVLYFCKTALNIMKEGSLLAMFLKITFLEGQNRNKFFNLFLPQKVLVFSKRIQVAINGDIEMFKKSSAACYAWFVWQKGWQGDPIIKWIK
jgi:hypothetical protein